MRTMQLLATYLLLIFIIASSDGRLFREKESIKDEQDARTMSLKDLAEAENPINLRGICDVNYVKIGCFKDKKNRRVLSQELFQDRSSTGPNYSGQSVDWADYSTYLKGTMQLLATSLLLMFIIASSDGRLFRGQESIKHEQDARTMTLKDLAEAENPINLRGICDVNYVKIGCFKDKKNRRALSQELFQDRSSTDPNYSGQSVDWADYSTYLKGLACRCAQRSRQDGFTYFGLQDYGRCFSAAHAASSYNMYGSSNRCSNQHYQNCDDNAWGECVGKAKEVNYVYHIVEAGSADGEISYGKAYDQADYEGQN